MAATENNLLDSIFYFFTKPLIVYKIFYFLWSNETLGENSFFINSPVDNLEDVLYKIRDDFALSTQEYSTFRDEASKETDSQLFAFIQQSLDESNFWNDDLWSYHTLEHQRILLEAIKVTKSTCAIRNPSTSLLKALEANHTVYIKNYITFL